MLTDIALTVQVLSVLTDIALTVQVLSVLTDIASPTVIRNMASLLLSQICDVLSINENNHVPTHEKHKHTVW